MAISLVVPRLECRSRQTVTGSRLAGQEPVNRPLDGCRATGSGRREMDDQIMVLEQPMLTSRKIIIPIQAPRLFIK